MKPRAFGSGGPKGKEVAYLETGPLKGVAKCKRDKPSTDSLSLLLNPRRTAPAAYVLIQVI